MKLWTTSTFEGKDQIVLHGGFLPLRRDLNLLFHWGTSTIELSLALPMLHEATFAQKNHLKWWDFDHTPALPLDDEEWKRRLAESKA